MSSTERGRVAPALRWMPSRSNRTCLRAWAVGRPRLLLSLALILTVGAAARLQAQGNGHPGIARAVAAYESGDFGRARSLLDSLPPSLPAADQAIRFLYRGLIHFAFGELALARSAFARAIQTEPSARLDPAVHAPSRLVAYVEVLDSMAGIWRREAEAAEAAGDLERARRSWNRAAAAVPSDSVARVRLAAVERMLAGPVPVISGRVASPSRFTVRRPDSIPSLRRRYSTGRAAALGIVPGLGQVYAGRTTQGLVVLAAASTAVALGSLYEVVDVKCLSVPVDNRCPPGDVVSERSSRPYQVPGVAAAAALTLIGAIDAVRAARRANSAMTTGAANVRDHVARHALIAIEAVPGEVRIELLRLRF